MKQVRFVFFEGCPNHEPIVALVQSVADELNIPVEIKHVKVESEEDAIREKLLGSPTVLVDGVDLEPAARTRTNYAMSCRVYTGPRGLPDREMVTAALRGEEPQATSSAQTTTHRNCCI